MGRDRQVGDQVVKGAAREPHISQANKELMIRIGSSRKIWDRKLFSNFWIQRRKYLEYFQYLWTGKDPDFPYGYRRGRDFWRWDGGSAIGRHSLLNFNIKKNHSCVDFVISCLDYACISHKDSVKVMCNREKSTSHLQQEHQQQWKQHLQHYPSSFDVWCSGTHSAWQVNKY